MQRQRGREMLRDRNAYLDWETTGPIKGSAISGWSIGGTIVILHEYHDDNGFEIYHPVNEEDSLAALTEALDKLVSDRRQALPVRTRYSAGELAKIKRHGNRRPADGVVDGIRELFGDVPDA